MYTCVSSLGQTNSSLLPEPTPTPLARLLSTRREATSGSNVARSFSPGIGKRPEQYGHPEPIRTRDATDADHTCPSEHRHSIFLLELANNVLFVSSTISDTRLGAMASTVLAVSEPSEPSVFDLFGISITRVLIGLVLTTASGRRPSRRAPIASHFGQKFSRLDTLNGLSTKRCPCSHSHSTFIEERGFNCVARFLSTNLSAKSGRNVAKSSTPHIGNRPEQYGHPEPPTRLAGVDTYTCPFSQRNCILFIDLVLIEDMSDLSTNSLAMVGCVSMR